MRLGYRIVKSRGVTTVWGEVLKSRLAWRTIFSRRLVLSHFLPFSRSFTRAFPCPSAVLSFSRVITHSIDKASWRSFVSHPLCTSRLYPIQIDSCTLSHANLIWGGFTTDRGKGIDSDIAIISHSASPALLTPFIWVRVKKVPLPSRLNSGETTTLFPGFVISHRLYRGIPAGLIGSVFFLLKWKELWVMSIFPHTSITCYRSFMIIVYIE